MRITLTMPTTAFPGFLAATELPFLIIPERRWRLWTCWSGQRTLTRLT